MGRRGNECHTVCFQSEENKNQINLIWRGIAASRGYIHFKIWK